MLVHERVALTLAEAGVDTVFGLMGDANLRHLVSLIEQTDVTYVPVLDEGGAVSMADGYSRVTGKIGVASVTHGPGMTNTLTALTEAVRAGSQLLVLTGDTPPRRDHLQRLDLRAAAELTGARYVRALTPATVASQLWDVLAQIVLTSRPVVFDVPLDINGADGAEAAPPRSLVRPTSVPSEDDLDRALGIVAAAKRPVILAGRGAVLADARDDVIALSELLGAPLGTTLLGKGMFDGVAGDLGIIGTLGAGAATDAVVDADCLLVFGAGLNKYTTMDGEFLTGPAVVQVDHEPSHVGKLSAPAAVLIGDVALTARTMAEMLRGAGHQASRGAADRVAARVAGPDRSADFIDRSDGQTIDLRTAMLVLDDLLPVNRAVVTDTGRFTDPAWRYLSVGEPQAFVHTLNFASIGLGIATAVGASVARRDRLTVAVVGDGGGMMGMGELTTAVREKLPLLIVVANDSAYGMEYRALDNHGVDPAHSRLVWPEFADVARGYGAGAVTVRTREELVRALAEPFEGPFLIDIKTDPAVDLP